MTGNSLVAVYAVGEGGSTGEQLGRATLAEPTFVLAHPPLNADLGAAQRPLRVAIASGDGVRVEVIDVAEIHVVPEATDLVLLVLATGSLSSTTGIPVPFDPDDPLFDPFRADRAAVIAGLRTLLAAAPPPPDDETPVGGIAEFFFCLRHPNHPSC